MSKLNILIILLTLCFIPFIYSNTECVWVTGLLRCEQNQSSVVGSIVYVYDLDGSRDMSFRNPFDKDDKAGFVYVDKDDGLFEVSGCASDQDWFPGILNKPEFYIKVRHNCGSDTPKVKTILPVFQVFSPNTYDYHIDNPIYLD